MDDKDDIQLEEAVHDVLPEETSEPEIDESEGRMEDKIKSLKAKLKESEDARTELLEDLQRTKADFLNSKRRIEEQSARNNERTTERLLTDLLPLIDSFDTAMSDKEMLGRLDPKWKSGMEGIHGLLINFLKSYGVTEIETEGKHFSPHEHEAISNVPVTDAKQVDTVITVLQKGFKRNNTVLRPAKVTVGTSSH